MDAVTDADRFSPATRTWFDGAFEQADRGPGRRLGGDRPRRPHAGGRADRVGQDAGRVPLVAGPAGRHAAAGRPEAALPGALRVPAEGARRRRRAQPARPAGRHPPGRRPGSGCRCPTCTVGIRSGDTPADERRQLARRPPDILITTPESLFLMLTSAAREALRGVETVIVDEVHAVCGHQARRAPGAVAWSGWTSCCPGRPSGSGCRRPSGRSRRWPGSWPAAGR